MPDSSQVFLAYPSSPPQVRETMAAAASRIASIGGITAMPWENLNVGGRIVIREVLAAIDRSAAVIAEVTHLNENVLFELGYAIGRRKRVFPLRDPTLRVEDALFRRVRILTDVGYTQYANQDDIFGAFARDRPDVRELSLWDEAVEPALRPAGAPSVFYVTSGFNNDASSALTRVVKSEARNGMRLITADPREMDNQSLTWYAQQVQDAVAVVIHFESPGRIGSDIHNPRCAFIGGLAHGVQKPLLMLAAEDYATPFDYQDLLYVYRTAAEASARASYWLPRQLEGMRDYLARVDVERERRIRSTELRTLLIGEPVAENESETLADYFVATPAYQEAIAAHSAVFVGRRGAGKTALMLEAARKLREDRRVIVCTITPTSYQLEGLVRLVARYAHRDTRGYVIEAIWKFLLISEIALAIVEEVGQRPAGLQPNAAEWELSVFLQGAGSDLNAGFDVRLERAIARLEAASESAVDSGVETERDQIVEELYRDVLGTLRRLVARSIGNHNRVAVLVDDLDKAWDDNTDLEQLSYLLLGLLAAAPAVVDELRHGSSDRYPAVVTLATFIRSDIFRHLLRSAREPDKIPVRRVVWGDSNQLLAIVDRRYEAAAARETEASELWSRYFVDQVRGLAVRDYIIKRVLPKPRDVLVFVRAAIDAAVLRGSPTVEEEDVLAADAAYSEFAFDALRVDDAALVGRLEEGLLEFAGGSAVLSRNDLEGLIAQMAFGPSQVDDVIDEMRSLSFLGVEVGDGRFDFADDPQTKRRADVLARRFLRARGVSAGDGRLQVHPAFRPYLEIAEGE